MQKEKVWIYSLYWVTVERNDSGIVLAYRPKFCFISKAY
jgi:hypothetical protein